MGSDFYAGGENRRWMLILVTILVTRTHSAACQIEAPEILVATLPQRMVVELPLKGGIMLGSAVHSVGRNEPVSPNFVMAGLPPLKRLAAVGINRRTHGHLRPTRP